MGAQVGPGIVIGPCETLNAAGLAFLIDMGAQIADASADRLAPLGMFLQSSPRSPEDQLRCWELLSENGFDFLDTRTVAVHR